MGDVGVTIDEAKSMIAAFDSDGNGSLSFEEFIFVVNQGSSNGAREGRDGVLTRIVDKVRSQIEICLRNSFIVKAFHGGKCFSIGTPLCS